MSVECPFCERETSEPLHTDKEVRELAEICNWDEHAVCATCYTILRIYRDIVRAKETVND